MTRLDNRVRAIRRCALDRVQHRVIIAGMDYSKIITIEPGKRSGKPCIRGLRIPAVYDVLEYLASGMTPDEIVRDFPISPLEDIQRVSGLCCRS